MFTFSRINDTNNSDMNILSLDSLNKGSFYCLPLNNMCKKNANIGGCTAKDINIVNFWIKKSINFLINPFDWQKRYFDLGTINMIKEYNVKPVILLDEIKDLNNFQTASFLRNARIFNKFCVKKKIPIIIDSGGKTSMKTNSEQELYNYTIFNYNLQQGKYFNEIIFGDIYENKD
jgi:hypothetical protein